MTVKGRNVETLVIYQPITLNVISLSSRLVAVRSTVTGRVERWDRNALRASIYTLTG